MGWLTFENVHEWMSEQVDNNFKDVPEDIFGDIRLMLSFAELHSRSFDLVGSIIDGFEHDIESAQSAIEYMAKEVKSLRERYRKIEEEYDKKDNAHHRAVLRKLDRDQLAIDKARAKLGGGSDD